VPGTDDTGNHCDDCLTSITLPFAYSLYGQIFNSASVDSNGTLQFVANVSTFTNTCLPATGYTYTIFPMWDDLYTINSGYGVYTSVSGSSPNRIFNIEWRAQYFPGSGNVNFEVRLYEGQSRFDLIYGAIDDQGASATVGVQKDGSNFTQYECNTGGLTNGLMVSFTLGTCGSPSPTTPPNTPTTPPNTPTTPPATVTTPPATATSPEATPTSPAATATSPAATVTAPPATVTSPPATNTPVGPTPTACTRQFRDVRPGSTYFQFIHCLFCLGIVDGYPDGTFRPNANLTRGQLSKIVANSAGFHDTPTGQQFQDVPPSGEGSTFYAYIYRLVIRGYISGYPCGGPFEPCVPPDNLPYFRPNAPASRGQISKIVSNAAGYNETPSGQQFQDVPPQGPGSTFYVYIYRLVLHNIIQGYPCGSVPQEPCIPPQNLPYFRPNNLATRGQM